MKAHKLGLILGMNMAAVCLVMQGCKAVRPEKDVLPPPETTTTVDIATEPAPTPAVPDASVQQQDVPTPPPPPQTRTVGKLPPPPPPAAVKKPLPPPPAGEGVVVHVVQRGELLSSISRKYNVKMSAIVAANPGLNPDRIRIGQKLKIPAAAAPAAAPKQNVMLASAPAAVAANTTAPVKVKPAFKSYTGPTKDYVVKGGDSLGKIAYENGITIRALKEMNGLTKDIVRVGQKLKIPAEKQTAAKAAAKAAPAKQEAGAAAKKAVDGKQAAVPASDGKEVKDEAAPAAEQKPAEAGQKPAEAAAPAAEPAAEQPAPAAEPAGNTYTVKEGDDLVSISIAWGISPSQLLNANDIKEGEALKPGQVLKLPPNAKQTVQ